METRKKKGIGFLISGIVFLAVGFFNVLFDVTPAWVTGIIDIISAGAVAFGFKIVFPDGEK